MALVGWDELDGSKKDREENSRAGRSGYSPVSETEDVSFSPFDQAAAGFSAGIDQEQALFGAAKAGYGSLTNDAEMTQAGLDYYRQQMAEADENAPLSSFDDVDGLASAGNFIAYTLGNAIPSLATTVVGGGIGGAAAKLVAKKVAKDSIEESAKLAADAAAKDIVEESLKNKINNAYKEQVANKYARYGVAVGGAVPSTGLAFGENFARIYEETGLEDPGTALVSGLFSGALDSIGAPFRAMKLAFPDNPRMLTNLKEHIADQALTSDGRKRFGKMMSEGFKSAGQEGLTEATQEFISRSAVMWAKESLPEDQQELFNVYLFNEEARSNYFHAAVAGGIVGKAVGAGTGAFQAIDAPDNQGKTLDLTKEKVRQEKLLEAKRIVSDIFDEDIDADGVSGSGEGIPTVPPIEFDEDVRRLTDTLETIGFTSGITKDELAKDNGISSDQQQEILDILIEQGRITSEVSDGVVLYSEAEEAQEAQTAPEPAASTTTIETDGSTETTTRTLEEMREETAAVNTEPQQEEVTPEVTPPAPSVIKSEPTISPIVEGENTTGITQPTISPSSVATQESIESEDRTAPTISPLTDENRVIAKPVVKNTQNTIGIPVTEVRFPDSGARYQMKEYARDAGGGWYLASDDAPELGVGRNGRPNIDLGDDRNSAIETLTNIERQRASSSPALEPVTDDQVPQVSDSEAPSTTVRVSQPDANPKQKRNLDNPETETDLTFPDGDVRTIRKDGEFWYDAETDLELGDNKLEAVQAIKDIRQEEFEASGGAVAAAPQEIRVQDPSLDAKKSTKKDENFQFNGEHIVSFSDGDERRMYYDDQSRGWYDREALGTAAKGMDGYLGGNKKDALERFKTIRQEEFDSYDMARSPLQDVGGLAGDLAIIRGGQTKQSQNRKAFKSKPKSFAIPVAGSTHTDKAGDGSDLPNRINELNKNVGQPAKEVGGNGTFVTQKVPSLGGLVRQLMGIGTAPIVEKSDKSGGVTLNPVLSALGIDDVSAARLLQDSPEARTLLNTLVDISERGMPTDTMEKIVRGIYSADPEGTTLPSDALGMHFPRTGSLGISPKLLQDAANDAVAANTLMGTIAHEMWHAQDRNKGYTFYLPSLFVGVRQGGIGSPLSVEMGDVTAELFDAWDSGSELGQVFNYPLTYLQVYLDSKGGNTEKVSEVVRKEMFAQLGALYITNPALLENAAPKAYKMMQDIQRDPRSLEELLDADATVQETDTTTQRESVSGEVRAPTVAGVVQVPDDAGTGGEGRGGGQEGTADSGVGEPVVSQDGDDSGRSLLDDLDAPDAMIVSTRYPTGAKRTIEPNEEIYQNDLESYNEGTTAEKNAVLVRQYNNLTEKEKQLGTIELNEALVEHVRKNLVFIFDQVPQGTREQSKLWYEGANRVAQKFADKYEISLAQASAVIANMSPQKDWYMNASLAERTIDIFTIHKNDPYTPEMAQTAKEKFIDDKDEKKQALNQARLDTIEGKSLQQLLDEKADKKSLAMWIRVWDQTYNDNAYRLVSPDGKFLEFEKNQDGKNSGVAWGSLTEIGKAVDVLVNADQLNISESLGVMNKVRNFFNNIFDPKNLLGFVTIDTHAVAAGLLKPLSGNSLEVSQNFGTGAANSSVTGHRGVYSLFEEAYKRAAADRGVLPREMQSITWEAARGLFPRVYKNKQNKLFAESVWDQYSAGKLTLDETRTKILKHAGGIDEPVWKRSDNRDFEEASDTSYVGKLSGSGVPRQGLQGNPSDRRGDSVNADSPVGQELDTPDTVEAIDEPLFALSSVADPEDKGIKPFQLNDNIAVDINLETRLKGLVSQSVRQKVVDRLERLKEAENQIAKSIGLERLPSELSAYDAENLMHSKAQSQLESFEEQYVVAIIEEVKAAGLDVDQVGLYLLAKHAPERNKVIAEKERALRAKQIEGMQTQIERAEEAGDPTESLEKKLEILENAPFKYQSVGSGMTDQDAASVLMQAKEDGKLEVLDNVAGRVYAMLDDMRENMVSKGLLDDDTRNDWEETYSFYVPLKGFASYPEGMEIKGNIAAAGFSIRGSESFKAKGRITLPVNPLLVAFKDAEEKIIRAERNVIAQRLLALLNSNESPDNWNIWNNKNRPTDPNNPAEKMSVESMKSEVRKDDGMAKYIQVKRGGQTFFVEVKDRELNRQLQSSGVGMFNSNVDVLNKVLTGLQSFQNFRRNMLINYNPSWGLVNPIRDIQTGLAFALSEQDVVGGRIKGEELIGKITTGYKASLKAFWRSRRGTEGVTDADKEYDQYAKDYIADGAPTGMSMTKSLAEQSARFDRIINQGNLKKKLFELADFVEDYNQTMENAVRLSTYVEARKSGTARADAATLAKDLTVNFNRKGEYSSAVDSLYLFFNAAVQGNVNIAKAILRPSASGKALTKARLLAASMVAFGFARTLMNIQSGGEDEDGEFAYADFNEYVLKTSMVVVNPFSMTEGQSYAMPMPYGYGLFDNLGRYGAELSMGVKTPTQIAIDLANSVDHHFNPMSLHASKDNAGLVEASLQKGIGFLPDIGVEFAEQLGNINFFGSDITIRPNSFLSAKPPPSEPTKRGTNEYISAATTWVNEVTGGSEQRTGFVSINPERVQHVYEFFLGGVGRFLDDSSDTVAKMISEEPDLKSTDLPILRTFLPLPSEYSDRMDFYRNRDKFAQASSEHKNADFEKRRELEGELGYRVSQFKLIDKRIDKKLRKLSKEKKRLEANPNIDPMLRFERLERISVQQESLYDEYNMKYKEITK